MKTRNAETRHYRLIIGLLVCATVAVYIQVKDHSFVDADDPLYITHNTNIQNGLTPDAVAWACTTGYAANWHPLTWMSHTLDYRLYGQSPTGHHLTNLLLHIANTVLLFHIFARITHRVWQGAFIAAVFALHPLHVESVAWAAERKDVLSALFLFLTIWTYTIYAKGRRTKHYWLAHLFFALGLLAKPMLVTLPFVLLLLDYWPLRRFGEPALNGGRTSRANKQTASSSSRHGIILLSLIREKTFLFVLSATSSLVTIVVQQQGGAVPSLGILSLEVRIANALVSYVKYIGDTLWPHNLAVFYPHPLGSLPVLQVLGAALFLLAVSWVCYRFRTTYPYLIVGWLWFLGMLVPVIGIVQVGEQSMADRYMYVPLIGLSVIVAWGANDLLMRWSGRRKALLTMAAFTLCILAVLSWKQVGYWRDTITLFDHATRVTKNNYVALTALGTALQGRGQDEIAISRYNEALQINASYELAHYNLAITLQSRGDVTGAISHLESAARLNSNNSSTYYALGAAHSEVGDVRRAIPYYLRALALDPGSWQAHYGAGLAHGRSGNLDSAVVHFLQAVRLNPGNAEAHFNLGLALHKIGDLRSAIIHYAESVRLNPANAAAYASMAAALHQQGKINDAISLYRQALRLNPDFLDARRGLEDALQHRQRADSQ